MRSRPVPDAIGIISWNEFSENTHIEPSERYGNEYVRLVADITGRPKPAAVDFDSSSPGETVEASSRDFRFLALGLLGATIVGSMAVVARRRLASRAAVAAVR